MSRLRDSVPSEEMETYTLAGLDNFPIYLDGAFVNTWEWPYGFGTEIDSELTFAEIAHD